MATIIIRPNPADEVYVGWTTVADHPTDLWLSRQAALNDGVGADRLDRADVYGTSAPVWGQGWQTALLLTQAADGRRLFLRRSDLVAYVQADDDAAERMLLTDEQAEEIFATRQAAASTSPHGADAGWAYLPPSSEALILAERATLGAVLLNPSRLADVAFLTPEDFRDGVHTALFAAARDYAANASPVEPTPEAAARFRVILEIARNHQAVNVRAGVPLLGEADEVGPARHSRLSASYIHTLWMNCPHPENAAAYARIVVEARIQRDVAAHAIRLGQVAAEGVGTPSEGAIARLLDHARTVHQAVAGLAERWEIPTSPDGDAPLPQPIEERTDSVRALMEAGLLGALLQQPHAVAQVRDWLKPEDFSTRAGRGLYQAVLAVTARGHPLDVVTLTAEAERRGLLQAEGIPGLASLADTETLPPTPASELTAAKIARLPEWVTLPPTVAARDVLQRAIARRAFEAASTVALAALRATYPVEQVTTAALSVTTRLAGDGSRLAAGSAADPSLGPALDRSQLVPPNRGTPAAQRQRPSPSPSPSPRTGA